jgi:hypothetical protein
LTSTNSLLTLSVKKSVMKSMFPLLQHKNRKMPIFKLFPIFLTTFTLLKEVMTSLEWTSRLALETNMQAMMEK